MIVSGNFKPAWYLRNPHLQTILANINKPPIPTVSYETVQLDDGDSLQLARGTASGSSTVLILHGLEGSLNSAYARRLIDYLNKRNIPVVFMFFRSCNGKPNLKTRSYHSGETDDLRSVISYLKRQGTKRISLVGYSLGGNVTLKYMGEGRVDDSISCAIGVSVPMLLDVCAHRMNRGFSRLYQHSLLKRLLNKVEQKRHLFQQEGYNLSRTPNNFVEFDDTFTAPIHHFDSAEDYYRKSSSRQFLGAIEKPTLILHAQDDPFMTTDVIPKSSELSEYVRLELSPHGGHVGFITKGILKPENWLEPRIYQWLQQNFL
jgi:uncharacterized protein